MSQAELQKAADELEMEPGAGQYEPQAASGGAPQQDYTAELERLADLHNRGVLTDEEFEAKKKQILGL